MHRCFLFSSLLSIIINAKTTLNPKKIIKWINTNKSSFTVQVFLQPPDGASREGVSLGKLFTPQSVSLENKYLSMKKQTNPILRGAGGPGNSWTGEGRFWQNTHILTSVNLTKYPQSPYHRDVYIKGGFSRTRRITFGYAWHYHCLTDAPLFHSPVKTALEIKL